MTGAARWQVCQRRGQAIIDGSSAGAPAGNQTSWRLSKQLHLPQTFSPTNRMIELEFATLEQQFDELLTRYQRMKDENQQLKSQQGLLKAECATLLQKNELATHKIEAMITRLKAMENEG